MLLVRPVGIGCVLYAPLLVSDAPPTIDTSIITDYIMTNLLCALPAGVHTAAVVSCLPVPATDLLWLGLLLVFKFYIIHNSTFTTDENLYPGLGNRTPTELLLLTACQMGSYLDFT